VTTRQSCLTCPDLETTGEGFNSRYRCRRGGGHIDPADLRGERNAGEDGPALCRFRGVTAEPIEEEKSMGTMGVKRINWDAPLPAEAGETTARRLVHVLRGEGKSDKQVVGILSELAGIQITVSGLQSMLDRERRKAMPMIVDDPEGAATTRRIVHGQLDREEREERPATGEDGCLLAFFAYAGIDPTAWFGFEAGWRAARG